jgi:hypothetical protein
MYLLVIGLVAVIVAFLVAAFFSMRRGHDDEDEPARRPSVRNRMRGRGGDDRDGDPRWDAAAQRPPARRPAGRGPAPSRRPGREAREAGRADRNERAGYEQSRGYEPTSRGYGERAPIRGYDGQRDERTPGARRSPRHDDATETVVQATARPARNGQAAPPARRGSDDSFGTGPVTALYDTGPSAAAPDEYATAQVNADPDLADSDVFPRVRADIPRPASKARPRSQPKARGSRPSRKHDDDDDWPSTEWDKLSDEQYWAELSADKPLATTARTAQSNGSAAAKPARGPADRPAATPRPDRDRAAAGPDRTPSRRNRDRAGQDDATQQLDARPGGRSSARPPTARARGAQAPEAGDRDTRAVGTRPGSRSGRPAPGRDYDSTERMPSRARPAGRAASSAQAGTGPMSAPPMTTGPATGPISGPISTGPVTGPTGVADPAPRRSAPRGPASDDPLTSPAYARDSGASRDSRSYRGSGRAARRDPARGTADASRGHQRSAARGDYPAAPAQYDGYPAAADGRRDYPGPASRHGYPPSPGERTDPNAGRPAASAGYPASPPPARPSYDDGRPAETTSPQAGAGNPYGSFVDSAPPPQPDSTGPSYPPAAPAAPAGGGQGTYGTVPAGNGPAGNGPAGNGPAGNYPAPGGYPDPYAPARDGYPAAAGHGSQDPGTAYYSAPPPAAAAQPHGAYPYPASTGGYQDSPGYQNGAGYPDSTRYQNGAGYPDGNDYPASNGYSAGNGQHAQPGQAGQAGYDSRYAEDRQQNARYPAAPGTDPYGPDGYGGYHSRQG